MMQRHNTEQQHSRPEYSTSYEDKRAPSLQMVDRACALMRPDGSPFAESEYMLLEQLALRWNLKRQATYPGVPFLARRLRLDERQIRRLLRRLEQTTAPGIGGIITCIQRGGGRDHAQRGKPTVYALHILDWPYVDPTCLPGHNSVPLEGVYPDISDTSRGTFQGVYPDISEGLGGHNNVRGTVKNSKEQIEEQVVRAAEPRHSSYENTPAEQTENADPATTPLASVETVLRVLSEVSGQPPARTWRVMHAPVFVQSRATPAEMRTGYQLMQQAFKDAEHPPGVPALAEHWLPRGESDPGWQRAARDELRRRRRDAEERAEQARRDEQQRAAERAERDRRAALTPEQRAAEDAAAAAAAAERHRKSKESLAAARALLNARLGPRQPERRDQHQMKGR